MVEVRLRAVRVDLQSNTPVLLLQETEGLGRTLPIFIGAPEATAIAFSLQGMDTPRPMTHDLIRDLLESLGADVIRVVVTELRSSTYYADIVLRTEGPRGAGLLAAVRRRGRGRADRCAAVRGRRPHGRRGDHAGGRRGGATPPTRRRPTRPGNPEEIVGEFRSFLDSIRPEDFSS